MPFPMRADESAARAIRRLARAQLAAAADTLNDDRSALSERIHEMRISIKRVRALVGLARPLGGRKARAPNRRLRKLAARTAALRDAEMAVETLDKLSKKRSGTSSVSLALDQQSLAAVRAQLGARFREAERSFQGARRQATLGKASGADPGAASQDIERVPRLLARELLRERRRVRDWLPAGAKKRKRSARAAATGLARTYRRARRAMTRAYRERSGAAFHQWRKAVKALRYQLQFLQGMWPPAVSMGLPDLEHLGALLGDEHDLTILEEQLAAMESRSFNRQRAVDFARPAIVSDPGPRNQLLELLAQRRNQLRDQARPIGDRLFAERPRQFKRRLRDDDRGDGRPSATAAAAAATTAPRGRGEPPAGPGSPGIAAV